MAKVHVLIASLAVLACGSGAAAQPGNAGEAVAAQAKAIRDAGFLAGRWSGEGWIQMGARRAPFRQTERVAPFLDGQVMLIEGRGVDPAEPAKVEHHAFAVLSWNAAEQRYDFRSYAAGRTGTFPARLSAPDTLTWEMAMPQAKVRYTIRVADGVWTEDGEVSLDGGATWRPNFHMVLRRDGEASFEPRAPGAAQ